MQEKEGKGQGHVLKEIMDTIFPDWMKTTQKHMIKDHLQSNQREKTQHPERHKTENDRQLFIKNKTSQVCKGKKSFSRYVYMAKTDQRKTFSLKTKIGRKFMASRPDLKIPR